jgi:erythronate-4-phosphate dehydrogenase
VKILVDENIPLAQELFGCLGEISLVPGREITESFAGLEDFDVLAIRSVTEVTPGLVDRAANLKIIGTATIGTDHIDLDYIRRANPHRRSPIAVLSAPGSNADSVADYIWYALAYLTRDAARPLSEMSLGIIGHGNCGSRVARRAEGFGMAVLRCDPPLAQRDPQFTSDSLEETLRADFVTLHVPLTRSGESEHPTYHMVGEGELGQMRASACLLNSARGAVVDSEALIKALENGTIGKAVLDVYEGEPEPPRELIGLAALATPHIAGYAAEGRRRGAVSIHNQICELLAIEPQDGRTLLLSGFGPPSGVVLPFEDRGSRAATADAAVRSLLARTHDIAATSRELKATLSSPSRGGLFDAMRRNYERDYGRHELAFYRVGFSDSVAPDLQEEISRRLRGFGMEVPAREPHYVLTAG